jgi:hypothetical protein
MYLKEGYKSLGKIHARYTFGDTFGDTFGIHVSAEVI